MHLTRLLLQRQASASSRNLSDCLDEFKRLVSEQSRCRATFEGWPPPSAIPVAGGTFPPLGRGIFVMSRALKDGLRTEPTLVLCCGKKPMLMFNRAEFEALVKQIPWIKQQMQEFYKLI